MKRYIFRLILMFVVVFPLHSFSQQESDTVVVIGNSTMKIDTVRNLFNKKVAMIKQEDRQRNYYQGIRPEQLWVHYAGNMGMFSFGPAWDWGKKRQFETGFLLGYIPKFSSDSPKMTLTFKFNYIPYKFLDGEKISYTPFYTGFYTSTVFGHEFWTYQSQDYPKKYYHFSTNTRWNIFVGQQFSHIFSQNKILPLRRVTYFCELSTDDYRLRHIAVNRKMKFKEMFTLSLGLRFERP